MNRASGVACRMVTVGILALLPGTRAYMPTRAADRSADVVVVKGTVTTFSGRPVADVEVEALRDCSTGGSFDVVSTTKKTGQDGTYSLKLRGGEFTFALVFYVPDELGRTLRRKKPLPVVITSLAGKDQEIHKRIYVGDWVEGRVPAESEARAGLELASRLAASEDDVLAKAWSEVLNRCSGKEAISEFFRGPDRDVLKEPVLMIAGGASAAGDDAARFFEAAQQGLVRIRNEIADYTCILVQRERVLGKLGEYTYCFAKVRNRQAKGSSIKVPFGIYMSFIKPDHCKGREVLFVEGANGNRLVAHEGRTTAMAYLPSVWLAPNSAMAMQGRRHPITELGIERMIVRTIELGERIVATGRENYEVSCQRNAKLNGRRCTLLRLKQLRARQNDDTQAVELFIDDELAIPIRYVVYGFLGRDDETAPIIEEQTYLNLRLNVGLQDSDFDFANRNYSFKEFGADPK